MVRQAYGRIVNIASQAGLGYSPWQGPHYHAAKAGVIHLTRIMAVELGPHGVTVNAVSPSAVDTPRVGAHFAGDPGRRARLFGQIPLGRLARLEEIAAPVAFLVSDDAAYITGETIVVNGGAMGFGIRADDYR
jgi:NAD(P)-dependent dehydrogenase (short-subunit alcohol dehydrogenase family)